MEPLIIFFDGTCVLCNRWVLFLCQLDKNDRFRFANFDHPLFIQFAKERNFPQSTPSSVIVWEKPHAYFTEAEAVFTILQQLSFGFKMIALLRFFPKILSNSLYRFVAKNRYQWFGKYDACPLPDPQFAHKFL